MKDNNSKLQRIYYIKFDQHLTRLTKKILL